MTKDQRKYDIAIVGGGLAGLSLAIQLARKNYCVILFEKEKFPFHKVCGEYISMESWDFIESLGIPLSDFNLPKIDTLNLTAPNGKSFTTKLPLGGFGISRFKIDGALSEIAKENGVELMEETKVENVHFQDREFCIQYLSPGKESKEAKATICCGAFGKRSNLDVKWKRGFLSKTNPRINNYVAVKYHVQTSWPGNVIGLHNFRNGYCGISKIEENKYCLCYLTKSDNLKESGNSIARLERETLFANPILKNIFSSSKFLFETPLTISQISFSKKTLVENNLLMIGDATGMITPLCGNGMSMAMHSSKMAAGFIDLFLKEKINLAQMQGLFIEKWQKEFSSRMAMGRILQSFFGSLMLSNLFVTTFKTFPFFAKTIISKTHGRGF